MAGETVLLKFARHEATVYEAGTRRGHSEALSQITGQISELVSKIKGEIDADTVVDLNDSWTAFESIISQLKAEGEKASQEHHRLLARFGKEKREARELPDRLRDAIQGALGGWRGQ